MGNSYIGLPADSAGKKLNTSKKVIEGVEVHNQVMTVGDAVTADTQRVDEYGSAFIRFAGGGFDFDSFGKAKVAQETILSNYVPEFDEQPDEFLVETAGTSELEYMPNEKSIRIKVDTAEGDSISRTSYKYHKYNPGISNTMIMTINPGAPKEGVTKRWGLFDEKNGLFFEHENETINLVIRSNVSGSVVDRKITHDNWNTDKVDGTGISKIVLNPTKSNICWIDYQWLGAGMVQWGIFHPNGSKIILHTEYNANLNNTVYMSTANLPIRYEIFNTADTASASEFKIHNAVIVMNEENPLFNGQRFSAYKGIDDDTIEVTDEWKAIIIARQKLQFKDKINHSVAMLKQLMVGTDKTVAIKIVKKAVLDGTEHYGDIHAESTIEISDDAVLQEHGRELMYAVGEIGTNTIDMTDKFSYLTENLYADKTNTFNYGILMKCMTDETAHVSVGLGWEELRMA